MHGYDSHEPLLRHLVEDLGLKTVLELGSGKHSTPMFVSLGVSLTTVEPSQEWANKVSRSNPGLPIHVTSALQFVKESSDYFDMAFVDSNPANERAACVQELLGKVRMVVAHDTEPESEWNYGYSALRLPEGFVRLDYVIENGPWTSVFTNDSAVMDSFYRLENNNE